MNFNVIFNYYFRIAKQENESEIKTNDAKNLKMTIFNVTNIKFYGYGQRDAANALKCFLIGQL